jgi:polyisoprenoid-binding protein YceI
MNTPRSIVRLDDRNARVTFSVRWFGVVSVRGSFAAISGTVEVPGVDRQDAAVAIEVESHSVGTGITLRDRHLRGLRFLDSARHPVIRFLSDHVSRRGDEWEVRGRLTLRGLEREVETLVRDERASATHRRLSAEFTVPRRPHAIGTAGGPRRLNPLLWAIADQVDLHVELLVPVTVLAAEHVPAR